MAHHHAVLIVEDDQFIQKVIRHTLKADFSVTTQSNGIEAMTWLDQGNPVDIVVTDLDMPFLSGLELIQVMRASSSLQNVPIIVLSSFDESTTRIACLEQGADDYITKPFNPVELKARITAHLRRSKSKSEHVPVVNPWVSKGISA